MNSTLNILLTFVFFAPIALMMVMNVMWMRTSTYQSASLVAHSSDPVIADERFADMEAANEGESRRAA